MIKIGILGCGKIAQVRHIPEYAANPDCRLVGFYNPTTVSYTHLRAHET